MKTQIIRLETHDDAISVKDKMGWGQTARILLVWPARSQILNRRLDLVFLQRHSSSVGAQLALVSRDADVRYYAKILNIPVYASIREAEDRHWRKSRRQRRKMAAGTNKINIKKRGSRKIEGKTSLETLREKIRPKPVGWLSHPAARLAFFTLGVVGVLAIGAILLPSAEIHLTPKTDSQNITIPVAASPKFEDVDLSGAVPARTVSVIVEGRDQIDSTGNIYIPDQTASGSVIFTNLTDQEILIPAGTVVSTLGEEEISFTTLEDSAAPPDAESETVMVAANIAGITGNVPAEAIVAIEGPLGLNLTVYNPEKSLGGTGRLAPAPLKGDYLGLHEKLLGELLASALVELEQNLATTDLLLATDDANFTPIEETYTPVEIQPADQLQLTLRIAYEAQIASGVDLKNLGKSVLEANLPENYVSLPETIDINHRTSTIRRQEDQMHWEMDVGWQIRATVDPLEAIKLALWQSPEQAAIALYENLPLQTAPEIKITPSWWPRLPILPFRVKVLVKP